jgi:aminoglycoside phosphotransferase family enzyme/predicted kinase
MIAMTDISAQQNLITALQDPRCYKHSAKAVRLIETHISWVLLAGHYAYKIKKAVNLGFLDFTSLEARRFFCAEEIRLNGRLAPKIYLESVPIGGNHNCPEIGKLPAIEYAVKMRRFPSNKLLNKLLAKNKVTTDHMDELAALLAHFHRGLTHVEAGSPLGSASTVLAATIQNFDQLLPLLDNETDRQLLLNIQNDTAAEYEICRKKFDERHAQGLVRECHGDLHSGNIVLIGGKPVPFDGIEFNPALRWLDVMDEASFLVMDLLHSGHPALAYRFLNAYLEITGDYEGTAVLRFYLAFRAMVRAKVGAIRASQPGQTRQACKTAMKDCRSYLALAAQLLKHPRAALIITHGLPGSGKTTFAQITLERLGAIRIRSDIERKRLFGLNPMDDSRSQPGGGIYSKDATQRTYARLLELTQQILNAGFPVIVDAAFLRHSERTQFHDLAQNMGVPFAIASIRVGETVLHTRLAARQASARDASEADAGVLQLLQAAEEPLTDAELADTITFINDETDSSFDTAQAWNRLRELIAQH